MYAASDHGRGRHPAGTQRAWDQFYSLTNVWVRSRCVQSLKSRIAFVLISKLYRQMYANTGIATDSARVGSVCAMGAMACHPCRRLFTARPMPDLSCRREPQSEERTWGDYAHWRFQSLA